MLRRLLVSIALIGTTLIAPAVALPASATVQGHASATAASCTYQQSGNHWNCITPGAFCPKAARGKYGYAKVTSRRYKCLYKSSDPYWRWRRA